MKIGVRAYAKHRADRGMQGGTPAAVRKALERGQIHRDGKGLIDVDAADTAWPADLAMGPDLEGGTEGGTGGNQATTSFTEARRRKEVALAQLRELEVAEREGYLVAVDDVLAENAKTYGALRGILLSIPGKYAPRFVGLRDFGASRKALDELVRAVMTEMVEWGEKSTGTEGSHV